MRGHGGGHTFNSFPVAAGPEAAGGRLRELSFQFFPSCCRWRRCRSSPRCGRGSLSILSQLLLFLTNTVGGMGDEITFNSFPVAADGQPFSFDLLPQPLKRLFQFFPSCCGSSRPSREGSVEIAFNSFPVAAASEATGAWGACRQLSILSQLLPQVGCASTPSIGSYTFNSFPVAARKRRLFGLRWP